IVEPSGVVSRRPTLEPSGVHRIGEVPLEPGARYTRDFVIDEWYDFEQVGKYEIRGSLRFPIKAEGHSGLPPGEVSQSVMIEPPNELALRRRSAELAGRALSPADFPGESDVDAARALSFIRDPVAVSYLIQTLASPRLYVRSIALRGIARFSTIEA